MPKKKFTNLKFPSTTNAKEVLAARTHPQRFLSRAFDEIGAGNGKEGFCVPREKGVTGCEVAATGTRPGVGSQVI